jgi:hypothetical protein
MGSIYEIICWTTGLRYIGQTTQSLKKRLKGHKQSYREGLNLSSKYVLEYGNFEIYQLEKVADKQLLKERELYYIQHTDCINIITYDFDKKEYNKKYMRECYNKTEKSKEYRKEYNKGYKLTERQKALKRETEKLRRERKKLQ